MNGRHECLVGAYVDTLRELRKRRDGARSANYDSEVCYLTREIKPT